MPASVTLTVASGDRVGDVVVFQERTCRIVGRSSRCDPRTPDPRDPPEISRFHLLLDVNPPEAAIRDLGSLNGTYVNQRLVGGRKNSSDSKNLYSADALGVALKDGDVIELAGTTFRVDIRRAPLCSRCFVEIPSEWQPQSSRGDGVYLCAQCDEQTADEFETIDRGGRQSCRNCGADNSKEVNPLRQGMYWCDECRSQPARIARRLLADAKWIDFGFPLHEYAVVAEINRDPIAPSYLVRRAGAAVVHNTLQLVLPKVPVDCRTKERFLCDLNNIRSLVHPCIERVEQFGFHDGIFFLLKDPVDAESLARKLKSQSQSLKVDTSLELTWQLLDGLEYAHSLASAPESKGSPFHGWTHQSLAPARLKISDSPSGLRLTIADFGLEDRFDRAGLRGLSRTGADAISPAFLSRQQILDYDRLSASADVWGAAACLYAMLTGTAPRDFTVGKDPWNVLLRKPPVPLRKRNPSAPEPLADVIDCALDDADAFRFQSVAEFRAALQHAVGH